MKLNCSSLMFDYPDNCLLGDFVVIFLLVEFKLLESLRIRWLFARLRLL